MRVWLKGQGDVRRLWSQGGPIFQCQERGKQSSALHLPGGGGVSSNESLLPCGESFRFLACSDI